MQSVPVLVMVSSERRRLMGHLDLMLLLLVCCMPLVKACPNACSGHGYCFVTDAQICICYDGFTGPDCSLFVCPAGRAWADIPSQNNTAHAPFTECSSMGHCDRATGHCICRAGFEGAACERQSCPEDDNGVPCFGRGRCLSMREAAADLNYFSLTNTATYTNPWDADMIFGCVCDEGYHGYDCSLIDCPKADDPVTAGVDEQQILDCQCPGTCSGYFTLNFRGQTTAKIPYDATQEYFKYRLEAITTISHVSINMSSLHVCSATGTASTINIILPRGQSLPSMVVNENALTSSTVSSSSIVLAVRSKGARSTIHPGRVSVNGTREWASCANRGSCDQSTGLCTCLWSLAKPSNQIGGAGYHRDCGYVNATGNAWGAIQSCPMTTPYWNTFAPVTMCSGVGNCSAATNYKCNCSSGYTGTSCEYKTCPTGYAWFDEATSTDVAHAPKSQCSNMGICSQKTGACDCDYTFGVFGGSNCGAMECGWSFSYITSQQGKCGDHGQCLSMAQLASYNRDQYGMYTTNVTYNTTWDGHVIHTCKCAEAYSTDNQGYIHERDNTYRGPYAYAVSDWKGYDCAKARCPKGDYWRTPGVNEIQRINCSASSGYFFLSFRGATTAAINHTATKQELKALIEGMTTVTTVDVIYSNLDLDNCMHPASCNRLCASNNLAYVEFLTEFGGLPLITLNNSQYLKGHVTIQRSVQGTRDSLECSRLGLCDEDTGRCKCLPGFASSSGHEVYAPDGTESMGHRGDCGWRNPHATRAWMLDANGEGMLIPSATVGTSCLYRDSNGKCLTQSSTSGGGGSSFFFMVGGKSKKTRGG